MGSAKRRVTGLTDVRKRVLNSFKNPNGSRQSWRHSAKIQARMESVAKLFLRGVANAEIARQINVSPPTVGEDIERLRVCWWERFGRDIQDLRAEAVARLRTMQSDAYKVFLSSRAEKRDAQGNMILLKDDAGHKWMQTCVEIEMNIIEILGAMPPIPVEVHHSMERKDIERSLLDRFAIAFDPETQTAVSAIEVEGKTIKE